TPQPLAATLPACGVIRDLARRNRHAGAWVAALPDVAGGRRDRRPFRAAALLSPRALRHLPLLGLVARWCRAPAGSAPATVRAGLHHCLCLRLGLFHRRLPLARRGLLPRRRLAALRDAFRNPRSLGADRILLGPGFGLRAFLLVA